MVFEPDQDPDRALLGDFLGDGGDDASDLGGAGPACAVEQVGDGEVAGSVQEGFGAVEGVAGDVQAEHLAFEPEAGGLVPFQVRDRDLECGLLGFGCVERVEQGVLANGLVTFDVDNGVHGLLVDHDHALAGMAEGVERARLDQRFDDPLVADRQGDLAEEVVEAGVAALLGAGADDPLDHVLADVADSAEPEPDVVADGGEPQLGFVHVGCQHLDAHPA